MLRPDLSNKQWIDKKLPSSLKETQESIDWMAANVGHEPISLNHGMLPFLTPMGKPIIVSEDTNPPIKGLRLQYGRVNHNKLSVSTAMEIANNLAGDPMKFKSGHQPLMDKDFELVFYQSDEVRTRTLFQHHYFVDDPNQHSLNGLYFSFSIV